MEYFERNTERPNLVKMGLKKKPVKLNGKLLFNGIIIDKYFDKPFAFLQKERLRLIKSNIGFTFNNLKLVNL